eukprot:1149816-Pelagomonas_calceolata.AAC.11
MSVPCVPAPADVHASSSVCWLMGAAIADESIQHRHDSCCQCLVLFHLHMYSEKVFTSRKA